MKIKNHFSVFLLKKSTFHAANGLIMCLISVNQASVTALINTTLLDWDLVLWFFYKKRINCILLLLYFSKLIF